LIKNVFIDLFIGDYNRFKSFTTANSLFASFVGTGFNRLVLFQRAMEENLGVVFAYHVG
jgi:hypothetical protein